MKLELPYKPPYKTEAERVALYQQVFSSGIGKQVLDDILFRVCGFCQNAYAQNERLEAYELGKQSVAQNLVAIINFDGEAKDGNRNSSSPRN